VRSIPYAIGAANSGENWVTRHLTHADVHDAKLRQARHLEHFPFETRRSGHSTRAPAHIHGVQRRRFCRGRSGARAESGGVAIAEGRSAAEAVDAYLMAGARRRLALVG
jgi:hypothetical protein